MLHMYLSNLDFSEVAEKEWQGSLKQNREVALKSIG